MSIEIFKNKNIIKRLSLISIIFSILMTLQTIEVAKLFGNYTIETLILTIYGGLDLSEIKQLIPVVSWLIPQLLIMYVLGNYISVNLYSNAIYIFTRTEKRYKWLLKNIINLLLYCIFYYLIQYLSLVIICILTGAQVLMTTESMFNIINVYFFIVLNSFLFVLFINILSLFINELYSLIVGLAVNIGSIFMAGFIYEFYESKIYMIKAIPFVQAFYSLHSDLIILQTYKKIDYFHINNFPISFSYLYILILIILLVSLGTYRIRNKDIY